MSRHAVASFTGSIMGAGGSRSPWDPAVLADAVADPFATPSSPVTHFHAIPTATAPVAHLPAIRAGGLAITTTHLKETK